MTESCPAITAEDLHAALRDLKSYVDITEEDLQRLYVLACEHARQRLAPRVLVGEVMTTEVVVVRPEDGIHEAARLLSEHNVSGLPVVDAGNHVLGLISEADVLSTTGLHKEHTLRDLVRHLLGEPLPARRPGDQVKDVMTTPALTTTAETDLAAVAVIMNGRRIKRLPVVDGDHRLVGIVSRADLVRAMVHQ